MISYQNSAPTRRYRDITVHEHIAPPLVPFDTRQQPPAPNRSSPAPHPAPAATQTLRTPLTYRTAQLGAAGRILNRAVLDTLSWKTGTCLGIDVDECLLITRCDESSETHVAGNHYFRIPSRRRRQAYLAIGDHVLLVADQSIGQLRIYPPAVLDRLFSPAAAHGTDIIR